jgi:hypothetical protein
MERRTASFPIDTPHATHGNDDDSWRRLGAVAVVGEANFAQHSIHPRVEFLRAFLSLLPFLCPTSSKKESFYTVTRRCTLLVHLTLHAQAQAGIRHHSKCSKAPAPVPVTGAGGPVPVPVTGAYRYR